MKKFLALVSLLVTATAALSQEGSVRIHTKPVAPSRETLDRLNLTMAWKIKVPMDGLHDGFFSVQLFLGKEFPLMVAQTQQGAVVAINAETGDVLWRSLVGRAYEPAQPAGVNSQTVFVCRREVLYALDRDTGKQVLYTVPSDSPLPDYGTPLEASPSAGLVADEEHLFIALSDRVVRYEVPNFRAELKLRPPTPGGKLVDSPQVVRQWSYNTFGGSILQTPILNRFALLVTITDGTLFNVDKVTGETTSRFKTEGSIKGVAAYNKSVVYLPCEDYFLYAYDSASGRLLWRFAGQSLITRSPQATDRDVYVTPSKEGMSRLERVTGEVKWNNKEAVKFLAVNKRFVYTMDRLGRVQVLDYDRGKELARWDTRDWTVPVSNDLTDRIYLAAHDGQIVCLHHREDVKPLKVKTFETLKPPDPGKKDDNKDKKDDKKDDMKDDKKDDLKDDKKDDMKDDKKEKGKDEKVRFERFSSAALHPAAFVRDPRAGWFAPALTFRVLPIMSRQRGLPVLLA